MYRWENSLHKTWRNEKFIIGDALCIRFKDQVDDLRAFFQEAVAEKCDKNFMSVSVEIKRQVWNEKIIPIFIKKSLEVGADTIEG